MNKIALGIHVGHDRGACLIINGKVVAAIANERLDRIKHSQSLEVPYASIDALLQYTGLSINDISTVGFSAVAIENMNIADLYREELFNHYKCEHKPFYFVHHHDAHAYSTFFSSGFDEALVFIFDGGGDFFDSMQESESIYLAKNGVFTTVEKRLQDIAVRHMQDPINHLPPFMPKKVESLQLSLARKYAQITRLLGFGFGQEGKTMGLTSYGVPLFDFSNLNLNSLQFSLTYKDILKDIYILGQKSGKPFQQYLLDERENIAATVQSFIENAVISLINNYTRRYGIKKICLAGGLFLNCLTNHKIIEKSNLNDVFIIPSAGDDGQALGCAYYAYSHQFGVHNKFEIRLPYLGLSYNDSQIEKAIFQKKIPYKKYSDTELIVLLAKKISENNIVAFHRGRTEIGPRALCHRSILANPTNPDMKDILNHRVKHREPFRPFAPTVAQEDQFEYFDLKCDSEYMLLATTVKKQYREKLSAITHIDNTARIQSVSKEQDPFLYALLMEIKKRTGFSVVLNTSFNVAGQPIVESPMDAINTFLMTDIDILVIENYVFEKNKLCQVNAMK